jgi:hypothetical protein
VGYQWMSPVMCNVQVFGCVQLDLETPVRARPIPDPAKGHRVADVYVPAEYRHYDLGAICAKLRVHGSAKFPELKPKE